MNMTNIKITIDLFPLDGQLWILYHDLFKNEMYGCIYCQKIKTEIIYTSPTVFNQGLLFSPLIPIEIAKN